MRSPVWTICYIVTWSFEPGTKFVGVKRQIIYLLVICFFLIALKEVIYDQQ